MFSSDDANSFIEEVFEAIRENERKSHPDPHIVVFCDQHLSSEMVRAVSWIKHEYGELSASVSRLDHWRCPKPGCRRCYDPIMLGYFSYDGTMGSRISLNPAQQVRCGRHDAVPFMYIGRSDRGRQYKCPFYKCPGDGEVVAVAVVDADSENENPAAHVKKEERKRSIEMTAFRLFAEVCGLSIDHGTVTSEEPPKPDIRCTVLGNLHWFEMAQIISGDVAAKISPSRDKYEGSFSFDQEPPFTDVIMKKANKVYDTEGAPVDLILHFDLRFGSDVVLGRLIDKHSESLQALVSNGPFGRVWIFNEWSQRILWSAAKTA